MLLPVGTKIRIKCVQPEDEGVKIQVGDIFEVVGEYCGFNLCLPVVSECNPMNLDGGEGIIMFDDQFEVIEEA